MPILADQATVPHRLKFSHHALVLFSVCLFATLAGLSAITISLAILMRANAGSPGDTALVAGMLTVWLATLINMYRHAIRAVHADKVRARGLS